jgi:hypothetical protein
MAIDKNSIVQTLTAEELFVVEKLRKVQIVGDEKAGTVLFHTQEGRQRPFRHTISYEVVDGSINITGRKITRLKKIEPVTLTPDMAVA